MSMKKFKKIYIEITNICNLNCRFCSKDNKEKKEMTKEEFEHVLKEINDYTDYSYLHVKGEPLLHSKFKEILDLCNKYNKQINITTNGILLKKRVNDILNSNVRQVNISLHSMVGSYLDDILSTSKLLSENGIYVVFRFWVYNKNQNENINKILNYFSCSNINEINVDNIKVNDYVYINKDEEFVWPNLNNEFITKCGTCYGLKTHIGILSDGTVIPCCLDSSGVIELGNIYKENLNDILNKQRTINMIEGFKNNKLCEELCQKCGFRKKVFHDKR